MKSSNELLAYHRYMTQIAILLGADKETAAIEMQNVIDFEVSLANVSHWHVICSLLLSN